jgi:hypothetical protein
MSEHANTQAFFIFIYPYILAYLSVYLWHGTKNKPKQRDFARMPKP